MKSSNDERTRGQCCPKAHVVTVTTVGGDVRGRRSNGVTAFYGIPYAEAPVGALRFAPPVRRRPWGGVFNATDPAAGAPQRPAALAQLIGMSCPVQDEDCLHVTVWTPSCAPERRRAVLYWIHGGGFEAGSPSNPLADGSRLSAYGDVVVVSVGYRLGAIGLLCLDGVPSNRSLLDQAAGLEWVRDNIFAFGGNPNNVTIFGSSAGGTCVAALLSTYGSSGLFQRAIVQSGSAEGVVSEDVANAARNEVLVQLGSFEREPTRIRSLLESISSERLVNAQRAASDQLQREGVVVPFGLALDERTLPRLPLAAIHAGSAKGVELLVGTNKDELRLWSLGQSPPAIKNARDLADQVTKLLGGSSTGADVRALASELTARYVAMRPLVPLLDTFFALATDLYFRMPALRLATAQVRHARVFSYLFSWRVPTFGGSLGAPHAVEIPFLFGTHERLRMALFLGVGADRSALSTRMQNIWTSFASLGEPSADGFIWPLFDSIDRTTVTIDHALTTLQPAWGPEVDAWSPVWRALFAVEGIDVERVSTLRSVPPPQMPLEQFASSAV